MKAATLGFVTPGMRVEYGIGRDTKGRDLRELEAADPTGAFGAE